MEDYLGFLQVTPQDIDASGVYNHVPLVAARYGREAFIALNEPDPVSDLPDPHGIRALMVTLVGI